MRSEEFSSCIMIYESIMIYQTDLDGRKWDIVIVQERLDFVTERTDLVLIQSHFWWLKKHTKYITYYILSRDNIIHT